MIPNLFDNRVNKLHRSWWLFTFLLIIVLIDRFITLYYFGFKFADIDQTVFWNGAFDYSRGIFHEPYFYGQAYNYMLEALIAVPLIWFQIPVYIALPITTSLISLFPFIAFGYLLMKRGDYFWTYLSLAIPVILPLEYNFLTTISRGFVQAHLFIPLLFLPLLNPNSQKYIGLLFIAAALSYVFNPSSIIILLPILVYSFLHHFDSLSYYIRALFVLPILFLDYLSRYFYRLHPERMLHDLKGLELDLSLFIESLQSAMHFKYLFPFNTEWGILYILLLMVLIVITLKFKNYKAFVFSSLTFVIILLTLAVSKAQVVYEGAGLFFTPSRLYLLLPITILIAFYLYWKERPIKTFYSYALVAVICLNFSFKNLNIEEVTSKAVTNTSFPVEKVENLQRRAFNLKEMAMDHEVDFVIFGYKGWDNVFDSYAFLPLMFDQLKKNEEMGSVLLEGDRRTWNYTTKVIYQNILLKNINLHDTISYSFDYRRIDEENILIKNNNKSNEELIKELKETMN